MKNKGFTLIELLGVIVLLAVFAVITIASINGVLQTSKNAIYMESKRNIESAARTYILNNMELGPQVTGEHVFITLQTLKDVGLLSRPLVDPYGTTVNDGEVIIERAASGSYSYDYKPSNYTKTGLVLWYDGFNHGTINTVWKDLSGNGNNITLSNLDYTATSGWTTNGLVFDGINDYGLLDINPTNILSMHYTFKKNTNVAYAAIVSLMKYSNPLGLGYVLETGHTAATRFSYMDDSYTAYKSVNVTKVFNTNTNYTVDIIIDKSTNKVKLYVNGVFDTSYTIDSTIETIISQVGLGRWSVQYPGYYTSGTLYNCMLYNRVLGDVELLQNYKVDKERFNL